MGSHLNIFSFNGMECLPTMYKLVENIFWMLLSEIDGVPRGLIEWSGHLPELSTLIFFTCLRWCRGVVFHWDPVSVLYANRKR